MIARKDETVKRSTVPDAPAIELSEAERSALVWAIEVARAVRLGDADVRVLLADWSVSVQLLDNLADRLVSMGKSGASVGARDGDPRPVLRTTADGMIVRRDDDEELTVEHA